MVIMCSDITFHDRNGLQDEKRRRKKSDPPPLPRCTPLPEEHVRSSHSEKYIICLPHESGKHCKKTNSKEVFLCFEPSKECIPVCKEHSRKRKRAKSRELRSGYLIKNCECERRNGLQDQCPRFECRGAPDCWPPPATCPPSEFSLAKHLVAKYERLIQEQKELKEKMEKEKAKMRKHKEENKDDFCKKAKLKRTHSDEKNCVTLDGQATTCPKKPKIDDIYDDCPIEKKRSCPHAEKHKAKHDYENICIELPHHSEKHKAKHDYENICIELPHHSEKHKAKHDYENICIEFPHHAEKHKAKHDYENICIELPHHGEKHKAKHDYENICIELPHHAETEKNKYCPHTAKHKEKHHYENICIELPHHSEITKCPSGNKKYCPHSEKHIEKHLYDNFCIELPHHTETCKKHEEHKFKRPHSSEKICIALDDKICPKKQKIDICFVECPLEKKKSYPRAEIKKEKHVSAKSKRPHSPRELVTLDGQVVKEKTYHKKEKDKNDCVKFCIDLPHDEAMSCPIFLPIEFCKSKHEAHKSSACLHKPSECFKLQKISKECHFDTKHSHSKCHKASKKPKSAKSICFKLPKEYCKSLGKVKTEPYFGKIVKDVHHMKHKDPKPFSC